MPPRVPHDVENQFQGQLNLLLVPEPSPLYLTVSLLLSPLP